MTEKIDLRRADEDWLKKAHRDGVKPEDSDKDSVDEVVEKKAKEEGKGNVQMRSVQVRGAEEGATPAHQPTVPCWHGATLCPVCQEEVAQVGALTQAGAAPSMELYRRPGSKSYVLTNRARERMAQEGLSDRDVAHVFDHYDVSYVDQYGNLRLVGDAPDGRRVRLVTAIDTDPVIVITVSVIG